MPVLTENELDELCQAARSLAERAGTILLDRFQSSLDISYKGQSAHDPVTEVDHAIEDMVRDEVHQRFPEHGVLGEERDNGGPASADVVWVIDPLDGTSNFINGVGVFACSIGILERGVPVAGALFLPINRYLRPGVYHARRGSGLSFNDERADCTPPQVQAASRLSTVPGGTVGVTGPAGRRFGVARTFGSAAAELAFAAEGAVQMALFDGPQIWDVAGGVILCQEAGRAVFTRPRRGEPWRRFADFAEHAAGPVPLDTLRSWNGSLVVGDPEVVPDVAEDLGREQGLRATARRAVKKTLFRQE